MKYDVVIKRSDKCLVEEVQEKLDEGWIPHGGITTWVDEFDQTFFVQAIVKKDTHKTKF